MNRIAAFFLVGLIVGAGVGAIASLLISGGGDSEKLRREDARLRTDADEIVREFNADREMAKKEIDRLNMLVKQSRHELATAGERIAELELRPTAPRSFDDPTPGEPEPVDPVAETGLTDKELRGRLMTLGGQLQRVIMSGNTETMKKAMQDILAAGGPGTLQRILDMYRAEEGIGPKSVLAHALAQSGDPVALEALKSIVLDPDAGLIERRTSSHGLAFSDDESLEPFLRQVASNPDIERGARANISFGLAKRTDDGIELYARTVDEAFAAKDSLATAYLSGLALLGKRAVPAVEKRLRTIKEAQARIVMIEILASNGGPDSIPVLREIANEPDVSKDVRDAAEKAAAKLAQPD